MEAFFTSKFEPRTSRIEFRAFLAFGGPRRLGGGADVIELHLGRWHVRRGHARLAVNEDGGVERRWR